ncbi:universal stress protein [Larkinella rosea]|uniref:Universal stress protein n=1 Tax=Larkinella rosea TaxID=2025312 RepID=A0A3P1BFV6_9BACT|nr:universal stress protein [Larkinella rosea]RRA99996.1 universal stress protein [Larkinella rosea]
MKTIVLATDFSKSAKPASDFALQLAEQLKARLVLLHVYHHPLRLPPLQAVFTPLEEKNKVSSRRKLYRLRDQLKKRCGDVPISILNREGATLDTIKAVVKEQKAELLVMGTAGANSPGAYYFGSQATEMILRTPVPLLLVPPAAHFVPFKHIVVAIDLEKPVNALALDGVLRFSNRFDAFLNVLCVSNHPADPVVQQASEAIRDLLAHCPHTLSIVKGDDLTETILQYATENRADLIMMLPNAHNQFLFSVLESNTQQMARQSDVPVLAIVS